MKWVLLLLSIHLFVFADDFDSLMGKKTKHWDFVTKEQDVAFLNWAKKLYEKHAPAQFTRDGAYKIPPVVHFIWLGPKQFPPESINNVRSWIANNPGWKVKFWTDRKRPLPCNDMQIAYVRDFPFLFLGKCYEDSQNWGEKSDILRYEILFQEGGVYADHDANCLQSFDRMHKGYDFYCGLEAPHEPFVGRNITCGNGVIGSRPGHPTIARVLALIAQRWDELKQKFRGEDPYSKVEIVMHRTYIALTDVLSAFKENAGDTDIIFPAAHFFAKSGITPLYSRHFYATSWDDFREKKSASECLEKKTLSKLKHDSQTLFRSLILILGFNFFCLLLFLKKKES